MSNVNLAKVNHLLTIDAQNDFCDPKGSLFVPGADADTLRLAAFVNKNRGKIKQIHATLDSHQVLHVAHPMFWVSKKGVHPAPFTLISADEVEKGEWTTTHPGWRNKAVAYVRALADHKRYPLVIWPVHCRIGSWGHSLVPIIDDAFRAWEEDFNRVNFVAKGSNLFTEHYSAVQADVPDPSDDGTKLNTALLDVLANDEVDNIFLTGQALSHCVANTVTDIADNFGESNIRKFILLEDTCSNVPTFEALGEKFVKDLKARGMRTMKSTDWF